MQGDHWIMIENSCRKLYFADSLVRKKYSVLKQQYEKIMPEPLQSNPSVCRFYTLHGAFHPIRFRQQKFTRVHDVNVFSFINNYM